MKNKKGFTLIEMLLTGTLLAIIAIIVVPNIVSTYKKAKENEYQRFLNDLFLSTEAYVQKHTDEYEDLKNVDGKAYIYVDELLDSRYLKSTLYDTKNKKHIKDESDFTIEVTKKEDGSYAYKLYEELYNPDYCEYDTGETWTFDYTGSEQEFSVPCSGNYKIELWGASGTIDKATVFGYNFIGGRGAYVSGNTNLEKDKNLYLYVGQAGTSTSGWNGGGAGYNSTVTYGGGATDIRTVDGLFNNFDSLKTRIMVAGAGGVSWDKFTTLVSPGGGLFAQTAYQIGYEAYYVTGGTQTSGGSVINYPSEYEIGTSGGFGYGGNGGGAIYSTEFSVGSFGGGSGWFGGAGGSRLSSGSFPSAGGSSYISGHTGCVGLNSSGFSISGCATGSTDINCSYSTTGYKFTNTVMIDGAGYNWTNEKGALINMPTHDGTSTMTGNNGNGYAKITYLGDNTTD